MYFVEDISCRLLTLKTLKFAVTAPSRLFFVLRVGELNSVRNLHGGVKSRTKNSVVFGPSLYISIPSSVCFMFKTSTVE